MTSANWGDVSPTLYAIISSGLLLVRSREEMRCDIFASLGYLTIRGAIIIIHFAYALIYQNIVEEK